MGLGLVIVAGARRLAVGAAVLSGSVAGIATIACGWHRPSDVVGGFLVATAWAAVALAVLALWETSAEKDASRAWTAAAAAASVAALLRARATA